MSILGIRNEFIKKNSDSEGKKKYLTLTIIVFILLTLIFHIFPQIFFEILFQYHKMAGYNFIVFN